MRQRRVYVYVEDDFIEDFQIEELVIDEQDRRASDEIIDVLITVVEEDDGEVEKAQAAFSLDKK